MSFIPYPPHLQPVPSHIPPQSSFLLQKLTLVTYHTCSTSHHFLLIRTSLRTWSTLIQQYVIPCSTSRHHHLKPVPPPNTSTPRQFHLRGSDQPHLTPVPSQTIFTSPLFHLKTSSPHTFFTAYQLLLTPAAYHLCRSERGTWWRVLRPVWVK